MLLRQRAGVGDRAKPGHDTVGCVVLPTDD